MALVPTSERPDPALQLIVGGLCKESIGDEVRYGSDADLQALSADVSQVAQSRHIGNGVAGPRSARSGHAPTDVLLALPSPESSVRPHESRTRLYQGYQTASIRIALPESTQHSTAAENAYRLPASRRLAIGRCQERMPGGDA